MPYEIACCKGCFWVSRGVGNIRPLKATAWEATVSRDWKKGEESFRPRFYLPLGLGGWGDELMIRKASQTNQIPENQPLNSLEFKYLLSCSKISGKSKNWLQIVGRVLLQSVVMETYYIPNRPLSVHFDRSTETDLASLTIKIGHVSEALMTWNDAFIHYRMLGLSAQKQLN